jgi:hypothetical protein
MICSVKVSLNQGTTNQAIRLLNIPSVIRCVNDFHRLRWALRSTGNQQTQSVIRDGVRQSA